MMHRVITVSVAVTVLVLVACGGGGHPSYQTVAPASLGPSDPIPTPTDDVILTISGRIATKNEGDTLIFDMPILERL